MHEYKLDYNRHCQIPLGTYVNTFNNRKKTNNQSPRKMGIIYLTVNLNKLKGNVVMDLKSELPINRRKVTEITVRHLVVKAEEKMAADDKVMTLKFENKPGVLLNTHDLMEGVDYKDKHSNGNKDINDDEQIEQEYEIKQDERVDA